jgi:hypothetical protein
LTKTNEEFHNNFSFEEKVLLIEYLINCMRDLPKHRDFIKQKSQEAIDLKKETKELKAKIEESKEELLGEENNPRSKTKI